MDWRQEWLPIRKRSNPHLKTQLVTCEEFNFANAFREGNRQVTKLLFEGESPSVREGLYKPFSECYENAIFILGSNVLPSELKMGNQYGYNQDVWKPLLARIDQCHLRQSYD